MREFETIIKKLKFQVLSTVAKDYWNGTLDTEVEKIPEEICPGLKADLRCCIWKERAVVGERVRLAMGGDKNNPNLLEVIVPACDQCPWGGIQVTDLCRGCLAHRCAGACHKDAITFDPVHHQAHIDKTKCINCGMCARACPYQAITNYKRPCKAVCPAGAISYNDDGISVIDEKKCTRCGSCAAACPFGAIQDKSFILNAVDILKDTKNDGHRYLIYAPSIGTQFQYAKVGQVYTACRKLGFDHLVEAAFGADMVTYSEAKELSEKGSLLSSCCPAFVRYVKLNYPELAPSISENLSPMAAAAKFIKSKDPRAKTVFVGPCISKKMEMTQENSAPFIDLVLTFEELQALFGARDFDISTLEEGKLDDATYFGRNFAKSGGLSAAVAEVLKEQNSAFEAKPVKCSGLSACKIALIQKKANTLPGNFIEGMACIGGCIGGPAALSHTLRDPAIMEAYAKQESSIHPSIEENIKKTGAPLDLPSTKK